MTEATSWINPPNKTAHWMVWSVCDYSRDDRLYFLERLERQLLAELEWMLRWCFAGAEAPRVMRPSRVVSIIRKFFVRRLPMWSSRRWRSVT